MVYLSRKNGNVGELRIIVTELDRAELLTTGPRWVDINDTINQFNADPDVTQLCLTASYAGDLKDEKLSEFIENLNNATNSQIVKAKSEKKTDKKEKVTPDGSKVEEDETEEEEGDDELKNILSEYDLTCKACGEKDKGLVDAEGVVHDCEACIKIDAYLKGKKEGFEEGYEKGYAECIAHLKKIASDEIKVTLPEEGKTNEPEKH